MTISWIETVTNPPSAGSEVIQAGSPQPQSQANTFVTRLQYRTIMLAATADPFCQEVAMTEMLFCYCCRVHHPKDQMRPFLTKQGYRWRCVRSIEAAACSRRERDAFGRQQTEINRTEARQMAERQALLRVEQGFMPG